jgi:hypothetical protein
MHNRYTITLGIVLTVTLAGFSFAQEENRDPWTRADAVKRELMLAQLMAYLGPRIDHIAENVARHYKLDEVPALRESARTALKGDNPKGLLRDASNAPSLEPLLGVALAKHLSEQRVEDYLAFTRARKTRDKQAVAAQLVAWADQHLSLRSQQREKLGGLFLLSANEGMTAQRLLGRDADSFMDFVAKLRLDFKQLDRVLYASQSQVWDLMMSQRSDRDGWRKDGDQEKRAKQRAALQAHIVKAHRAGKITREQAGLKLDALEKELRVGPMMRGKIQAKQEEMIRLIVAAKLVAHTEQLSELDARATKRLALVSKGVVEQVLESWDTDQRADPTTDITDYPLYQQTIKDVLSDDAHVRYHASQAQRLALRDQARRDLVVAYLDTLLLLSETQRNDFAGISAKQTVPTKGHAWALIVQVLKKVDQKELSPWQRELTEGMLRAGSRLAL